MMHTKMPTGDRKDPFYVKKNHKMVHRKRDTEHRNTVTMNHYC